MRFTRSCTMLLAAVVPGALAAQDGVKVGITTSNSNTIWYTDPIWIWAGAAVVLLIIVLAVMASRKKSIKSTTTVVR
jgi:amino acid transporter